MTKVGIFGNVRGAMRRETSFGFIDTISVEKHNICEKLFKWVAQIKDLQAKCLLESRIFPLNTLMLKMREKFIKNRHRNNIVREVEEVVARINGLTEEIGVYKVQYPSEIKVLNKIETYITGTMVGYIEELRIK